jgi:hypothetical protein
MKLIKEDLDERHYLICHQTDELVHNEKICKSVNCNPGHVYEIVYEQVVDPVWEQSMLYVAECVRTQIFMYGWV